MPGFAADCLETLEEIAQENAEIFKHNGGEEFSAIPCLNDSDAGMDVIRQLVLRELQDGFEFGYEDASASIPLMRCSGSRQSFANARHTAM